MSRDVATVVGTVVGGYYGGYQGAQIGYAVGSLVGNMYDPAQIHRQGPRLSDLKVQTSSYGNPIPICYGAMRVSGNMIWSTPIIETPVTTTSSAKGGPEVVSTSYSYTQSFAIALCEGEIAGIRKIWANGTLVYNVSDDADIATVVASRKIADTFRVYIGSESQTADSLIQANIGAADTPAYRGIAYVVFENMQLADFGNRTPNLEFEVASAFTYTHLTGERTDYAAGVRPYGIAFDNITDSVWVANYATAGPNTVSKINIYTGTKTDFDLGAGTHPIAVAFDSISESVWVVKYDNGIVSKVNIYTGTFVDYPVGSSPKGICFDNLTESVWITNNGDNTISKINVRTGVTVLYGAGSGPANITSDNQTGSVWVTNQSAHTVSKINMITGARIDYDTGFSPYGIAFDNITNSVWVANQSSNTVSKMDIYSGSKVDYAVGASPMGVCFDDLTESVWVTNYTANTISKVDIRTGSKTDYSCPSSQLAIVFDNKTYSVWTANYSVNTTSKFNLVDYGAAISQQTLSSIVSDICINAGLTAGQIDVTALTDSLHGYVVQRGSARGQLEQLMSAFFFDAVESDGKIKFVKRGGSSVIAIPEDDLAAHEYGAAQSDSLVMNRQQEMELPLEVWVQYLDTGAAYSIGSQNSQRLTTESENKASLNFAIAMTATKAKQISDVLMYDAWASRTSFDFETGWKYCYLEPTDIVTVTKGARTYTVRIIEDNFASISRRRAILEDTTAYTQTATAVSLPVPSASVSAVPLTDLMLLDIPLLRDADDGNGFYAAACGYGAGWSGTQVFKSNDGGATWSSFGNAILNDATIGVSSDALGDFTQNIFDEHNSVTVALINGELSSTTEINILNGSNVAVLGDEIIQFKTATLTATNTYKLTGLLRGRQGTEWARSTHAVGDRFVLLSTATTYPMSGAVAEYDLARHYRGASIGGFLDEATTISFTNTAVQAIPYAPVHLGGGRNADGDLTLNWIRRTRLSGAWNNYADVPIGETSEAYVVEIYNNSGYASVVRTITGITSATTSYTAAQQTTDFGSPQSTVYWKVYQVSATVGNGYEARGAT